MSKLTKRVQFIRESIDNHISEMQENDLIAEQVLVLCEQEGIDPESLTEEELHEIFNTLKKIGAGIKGAVGGAGARFMAGFNTPTTSDRAKSQLDKVRTDRFKRAKDAAIDYAGKHTLQPVRKPVRGGKKPVSGGKKPVSGGNNPVRGGNKPASKPARVKTPGSMVRPAHGGRTAFAESFNNFIDRTVGILMGKLEERNKANRARVRNWQASKGGGDLYTGRKEIKYETTPTEAGVDHANLNNAGKARRAGFKDTARYHLGKVTGKK